MSNMTLGAAKLVSDGRQFDDQEALRGGPRNVPSDAKHKSEEPLEKLLRPEEKDLLRQLIQDLRSIRYGSIVLVLHEGRLVEVSKTIRVRKSQRREGEKESEEQS